MSEEDEVMKDLSDVVAELNVDDLVADLDPALAGSILVAAGGGCGAASYSSVLTVNSSNGVSYTLEDKLDEFDDRIKAIEKMLAQIHVRDLTDI